MTTVSSRMAAPTEPASTPVREFRDVIGTFATGLTVLTTGEPAHAHGMTANAISSVSLEPRLVLACVSRTSAMITRLGKAGTRFILNILAHDQHELADRFSGRASSRPAIELDPWMGGSRLVGGLAAIACDLDALHDGGDHRIVVGRVVAQRREPKPRRPLIFYRGAYERLLAQPDMPGRTAAVRCGASPPQEKWTRARAVDAARDTSSAPIS